MLQAALDTAVQQQDGLERELASRPTRAAVLELQQQVRALQAVGYGSVEEEGLLSVPPLLAAAAATAAAMPPLGAANAAAGGGGGGGGSSSGGKNGSADGATTTAAAGSAGLEALLLSKCRRLEHDLTMARLSQGESAQELTAAREQVC